LASSITSLLFVWVIAEAFFLHMVYGQGKAIGTDIVHDEEAECLGERNAIGTGLEKFDLGFDSAKNGVQRHVAHGSMRNGAFGKDGRATAEGEALNYTDEVDGIHGEECALAVGNANARGAGVSAGFLSLPRHPGQHRKRGACGQGYGRAGSLR